MTVPGHEGAEKAVFSASLVLLRGGGNACVDGAFSVW
jgi:hypothetical protein